jgi:purine-cytosine permease-like protein
MAVTETSPKSTFVTVPGGRHSEVSRTLADPVPQALSLFDQLGLWGNLGVSLLGFTGATFVLQPGGTGTPELSLVAGLCAIVVGTLLGTLPVALAGLPGARTGAPAMVLLRGLFGARLTAVSTQNLRPLWDRRILALVIAALTTAGALFLTIADYENFLILLGSVFVPMSAVLIIDFFVLAKGRWDLSGRARSRWLMLLPWAAGFVTYQLINPGYVAWWVSVWTRVAQSIGFTPASWMSASICSFLVAAGATLLVGWLTALARRRGGMAALGERQVSGDVSA